MLNSIINNKNELSINEYSIYSKQIILDQINVKGQIRLREAKILVIGVGGLGCPVVMYLAISGIGCIGLIDEDTIELSNLNRQMLYEINDIKNSKVDIAAKRLKQINKYCHIIKHKYNLNINNMFEVISYYDIVIDTTDNFKIRYLIDEICYKLHKTCIYGAINKFEGQIAIFNYKNGIRYKDLYKKKLKLDNKKCSQGGIMGINTGYIGNLQALEAIKIILGLNKKCQNSIFIHQIIPFEIKKQKIYPLKYQEQKNESLESSNIFQKLLAESEIKTMNSQQLIIDLRQNNEFTLKHLSRSINISINKFKSNKTTKFIKSNIKNKSLMIYCSTNEKSKIASLVLQKNQIEHYIILVKKEI
uniref:Molybdopterin biosynthesis protein n=1 Tax=Polysiphonia urceolata TaxID=173545 RepID=A0A1Z1MCE5_POLUR|nr:Molybdopterin biosynthesis protein [Polysiphonia stricta]ARW63603.1 Molybdopterin biosynthesis protein [Polysiphonia stricta]